MAEVFSLTKPLWEIVLRATVVYFALVLLVRTLPKRHAGSISPNDMLMLIVIGGMGTDAIMGGSTSVGDILLMIGVVVAWSYALDFMEQRFSFLQWLLRDRQTTLIDNGRLLRKNMRREMITEEELMAILRKEGIDDLSVVRSACLEADGEISLVKKNKTEGTSHADLQ
jgi:uncharacterized membrane protein YcaP (DUF421 family)